MRRLPPVGSIQAFVAVARLGTIKAAACGMGLTVGQAQTLFGIVNTYEAAMGRAGLGQ